MSTNNVTSKKCLPMSKKYDRIVLLVDMDCFYCQVEEKLNPSLKGKPMAVVQYNAWKGGGIIAVNYAARAKGVTRHMRGEEAKVQCPEIELISVPSVREKADLTKYRDAGKDVAIVLQRFTTVLQRASVDEAYLDITDVVNKRFAAMNDGTFILKPQELLNTYAVGFPSIGNFVTTVTNDFLYPQPHEKMYKNFSEEDIPTVRRSNIRLLVAASIASEIRSAVFKETGYECSAGISLNKVLAKLACGLNKPNKQTILPLTHVNELFSTLPLSKIQGLGAKFGEDVCQQLGIRYVGQLQTFTEAELQRKFDDKNGTWLYNICRGIDLEIVTPRFYAKSIGCCKKFPGRNCITGVKTLHHWLMELANEISERLKEDIVQNNRCAKHMVFNFVQEISNVDISSSRSAPLKSYEADIIAGTCMELIKANTKVFFRPGSNGAINNPIKFLGISAGKFETLSSKSGTIQTMFAQQTAKLQKLANENISSTINSENVETVNPLMKSKDMDLKVCKKAVTEPNNTVEKLFKNQSERKKQIIDGDRSALTSQVHIEGSDIPYDKKDIDKLPVEYSKEMSECVIDDYKYINPEHKDVCPPNNNDTIKTINNCRTLASSQLAAMSQVHPGIVCDAAYFILCKESNVVKDRMKNEDEKQYSENICDRLKNENSITPQKSITHLFDKQSTLSNSISDIADNLNISAYHDKSKHFENSGLSIIKNIRSNKSDYLGSAKLQFTEISKPVEDNTVAYRWSSVKNEVCKDINKVESVNNTNINNNSSDCKNNINLEQGFSDNTLENMNHTQIITDKEQVNDNCELEQLIQDLKTIQNESKTSSEQPNKKRKLDDISDNFKSKDYRSEYVEFALPTFNTELELYIKCDKCGANIFNNPEAIQTHNDHHFAHEISQQQRHEYREHLRMKISSAKSPTNNIKTKAKKLFKKINVKQSWSTDITKFLKPSTLTVSEQKAINESASSESFVEFCNICKDQIKGEDMTEHRDYHLAKELQKELNKLDVPKVNSVKPKSNTHKNLNSSLTLRKPNVISKPITAFFTQPNDI